jgi:hypothetical protein
MKSRTCATPLGQVAGITLPPSTMFLHFLSLGEANVRAFAVSLHFGHL